MKKFIKITSIILVILMVLALLFVLVLYLSTLNIKFDESKLNTLNTSIVYLDAADTAIETSQTVTNTSATFDELPKNLVAALISVEDKRFFQHKGIDYRRLVGASINNIKSLSFKEGGSTISQQLIKNTHLTSDKTLKRKMAEFRLTKKLEKNYSKQEILSMYFNVIYFGNNSYGITSASKNYFNKQVSQLSLSQCATLVGMIKAPSRYAPTTNLEKCVTRRNTVLKIMLDDAVISQDEYNQAINEKIIINTINNDKGTDYAYLNEVNNELISIIDRYRLTNAHYRVFTYLDKNKQNICNSSLNSINYNQLNIYNGISIIINNKTHGVEALSSVKPCNVLMLQRQQGSLIKPLLVYSPCLEKGIISPLAPVNDEKTDFNGYTPQNYDKQFKGFITASQALSESRNVPTVKLFQYAGIEYCKKFISQFNVLSNNEESNLALALGGTKDGASPLNIASAYTAYANNGRYCENAFIRKITDENGEILFEHTPQETRVMSDSTAYLTTNMLIDCARTGTGRKLCVLPFEVACKTGTVGNSSGNSDAYMCAYTSEHTNLVWLGGENNNNLMDVKVTGGGYPAMVTREIFSKLYENNQPSNFSIPYSVKLKRLDSISLYEENKLEEACSITPEKYCCYGYFANNSGNIPLSNRFYKPSIKNAIIFRQNDYINISFEAKDYYLYKINRHCFFSSNLVAIVSEENGIVELKIPIEDDIGYYEIVPYYKTDNNRLFAGEPFKSELIY